MLRTIWQGVANASFLLVTPINSTHCSAHAHNLAQYVGKGRCMQLSSNMPYVYWGEHCPLSSRSIIECCVLPTLLYGAESLILNTTLLLELKPFRGEIGKRILWLPKFAADNTVHMALHDQWPSVRTRVLCIKLAFLLKILNNENVQESSTL
jgi:hypothetical protein